MSTDFGSVFMYPEEFFQVVAALQARAGEPADLAEVTVPYTHHDGANTTLDALKSAVDDARATMSENFVTVTRLLTAAGTQVVEADMAEEGVRDWTHLSTPGDATNRSAPTDDVPLYSDVYDFVEGSPSDEDS